MKDLRITPEVFQGTLNIVSVDANYFSIGDRAYPKTLRVLPFGMDAALLVGAGSTIKAIRGRTMVDGVKSPDQASMITALKACVSAAP